MIFSDPQSGNVLLEQARRGDQDAISEIYRTFFPAIYKFVRLQVEDSQLAEDITGEVFFKFVDSVGKRHGPQNNVRAWLYQVARNEIYRHFGKQRRLPTIAFDESFSVAADMDLELQFLRSVEIERAQRAFRMLAADQQEVLILRFIEMLSLQETASVMNKSTSAIKSLQFRAAASLRKLLEEARGAAHA